MCSFSLIPLNTGRKKLGFVEKGRKDVLKLLFKKKKHSDMANLGHKRSKSYQSFKAFWEWDRS